MADDSVKTISAKFETREAADRAIEHLVQKCGVERANIFVQASAKDNTTGISPSGGDRAHGTENRTDAPLHGEIEVSADVTNEVLIKAEQVFRDAGARGVAAR